MTNSIPAPPELTEAAAEWWDRVIGQYGIEPDDHAFLLALGTTLQAWDDYQRQKQQVTREGDTIKDRFEQLKPHPLIPAMRDARSAFMQGYRLLRLDIPIEGES